MDNLGTRDIDGREVHSLLTGEADHLPFGVTLRPEDSDPGETGVPFRNADKDLSFLDQSLQSKAIRTYSGEVMWPLSVAPDVISALAATGHLVLGLDLRSDGAGQSPPGLATELAWSEFASVGDDATLAIDTARDEALEALHRPDLAEMVGYEWVLVTWEDA